MPVLSKIRIHGAYMISGSIVIRIAPTTADQIGAVRDDGAASGDIASSGLVRIPDHAGSKPAARAAANEPIDANATPPQLITTPPLNRSSNRVASNRSQTHPSG